MAEMQRASLQCFLPTYNPESPTRIIYNVYGNVSHWFCSFLRFTNEKILKHYNDKQNKIFWIPAPAWGYFFLSFHSHSQHVLLVEDVGNIWQCFPAACFSLLIVLAPTNCCLSQLHTWYFRKYSSQLPLCSKNYLNWILRLEQVSQFTETR